MKEPRMIAEPVWSRIVLTEEGRRLCAFLYPDMCGYAGFVFTSDGLMSLKLCHEDQIVVETRLIQELRVIAEMPTPASSASPELKELREAANYALQNMIKSGAATARECELPDADLPMDEHGVRWFHDAWRLKQAIAAVTPADEADE